MNRLREWEGGTDGRREILWGREGGKEGTREKPGNQLVNPYYKRGNTIECTSDLGKMSALSATNFLLQRAALVASRMRCSQSYHEGYIIS